MANAMRANLLVAQSFEIRKMRGRNAVAGKVVGEGARFDEVHLEVRVHPRQQPARPASAARRIEQPRQTGRELRRRARRFQRASPD